MKESTLVSLAILRVNVNSNNDYLNYLKPFIKQILVKSKNFPINSSKIAESIKDIYGLSIPCSIIQIVLKRLAKDNILYRRDGFFWVNEISNEENWAQKKEEAHQKISYLIKKFILFAKENHNKDMNEEEAITCLTSFLSKFSISCLKYFVKGTTLPIVRENTKWQLVAISNFIKHIETEDRLCLQNFMLLVEGNMLANALLCQDLDTLKSNYKDVTFYFDTPILLEIIGLLGDEKERASIEFVKILQHLGGKICYFSHTADEIMRVIDASIENLSSSRGYGKIIQIARNCNKQKSDLILILGKYSEILSKYNILNVKTPKYINKYQIDEDAFSYIIDEELRYKNERAKADDINSVRSIYALRGDISPVKIESCKAIFVTSNGSFAKAAQEYSKQIENSSEIPPVITSFSLTNISWLKSPMQFPQLPLYEIVAFSQAALMPPKSFWDKVLIEAEALVKNKDISERDLQILRSDPRIINELFILTSGDDQDLTLPLKEKIHQYTAEIAQEKQHEIEDLQSKLNQSIKDYEDIKNTIECRIKKQVNTEGEILSITICFLSASPALWNLFKRICNDIPSQIIEPAEYIIYGLSTLFTITSYWFTIKGNFLKEFYFKKIFPKRLARAFKKANIKK